MRHSIVAKQYKYNSIFNIDYSYISDIVIFMIDGLFVDSSIGNFSDMETNGRNNDQTAFWLKNHSLFQFYLKGISIKSMVGVWLMGSFISHHELCAQPQTSLYTELGANSISNGLYARTVVSCGYQIGDYTLESGIQIPLVSKNDNIFSGYRFNLSREIRIKKLPVEINTLLLIKPLSEDFHKNNFGFLVSPRMNHFILSAGPNFTTYVFRDKSTWDDQPSMKNKIHEIWNMMYEIGYRLKPYENRWNILFSLTDYDYFSINQEINPEAKFRGIYKFRTDWTIFTESIFIPAGVMSTNVNLFGILFRAGLTWKIK